MSYATELKAVESLPVPNGQSRRFNCFECGGYKTLSVTRDMGELRWKCFKASCSVQGISGTVRTAADIRKQLLEQEGKAPRFSLPDYLVPPLGKDHVLSYLKRNNCMTAYKDKKAEILYDPKANRTVFVIRKNGEIVDAAGRAMKPGAKPKWLRYGNSDMPFACGDSDTAVVVEDCASACAVSSVATGVALLGTDVKDPFVGFMRSYKRVIVALDPDATRKALAIQRRLSYYTNANVVRLSDDLKYFSPDQIRSELGLKEEKWE